MDLPHRPKRVTFVDLDLDLDLGLGLAGLVESPEHCNQLPEGSGGRDHAGEPGDAMGAAATEDVTESRPHEHASTPSHLHLDDRRCKWHLNLDFRLGWCSEYRLFPSYAMETLGGMGLRFHPQEPANQEFMGR